MGFSSFNPQSSHGIMDEDHHHHQDDDVDDLISTSSSSSSDVSSNSSSSDLVEDATSSSSSSDQLSNAGSGPLYGISSLMQELPFKRGLSKFFQGKSQSFTSLSNVRSLEDLAKPENPYNKRLKYCKSYGGLMSESIGHNKNSPPKTSLSSRTISKKSSRGSCSSLSARRSNSFLGNIINRPPIPPQKSTSVLCNQTTLFV